MFRQPTFPRLTRWAQSSSNSSCSLWLACHGLTAAVLDPSMDDHFEHLSLWRKLTHHVYLETCQGYQKTKKNIVCAQLYSSVCIKTVHMNHFFIIFYRSRHGEKNEQEKKDTRDFGNAEKQFICLICIFFCFVRFSYTITWWKKKYVCEPNTRIFIIPVAQTFSWRAGLAKILMCTWYLV